MGRRQLYDGLSKSNLIENFNALYDIVGADLTSTINSRVSVGASGGATTWQEALDYIATLPQWEEVFPDRMVELTASKTTDSKYITLSANINAEDITKIATSNMFVSIGTETELNERKWYPIQWMDTLNTRLILKITAKETLATSTVKLARPIIRTLKNIDIDNADDASIVTDSLCLRLTGQDAFAGQLEIDINSGIIELDAFRTGRDGASVLATPVTSAYTSPVYLQRIYNMNHERGTGFDGPFMKHSAGLIIENSRFSGENHVFTFANNIKDFIQGNNLTIESRSGEGTVAAEPTSQAICQGTASYTNTTFICLSHKNDAEFLFKDSQVVGPTDEYADFDGCNFVIRPIGDSTSLGQISLIGPIGTAAKTLHLKFKNCVWDVDDRITSSSAYVIYGLDAGVYNIELDNCTMPRDITDFITAVGTFNLTWVNNGRDQPVAYAATITPDPHRGEIITVGEMTGNITMNAPVNPQQGQRVTFNFLQDTTATRTITWNASFLKAADGAGGANEAASTTFSYNGSDWIQQGGALTWF